MKHVTEASTAHPSHFINVRSILIITLHLHLGLPSGHFPSGVPNNILYAILFFLTHATCPTHIILLDFITITTYSEQHKWWSSSLHNFLHSHFQPYVPVFLGTLLTHPLSLPLMWDQVSHPNVKQQAKWQISTSFHFQWLWGNLSPGVVTRTCGSIYCQGEERVELTFNFPICLHGSHTKFNFTSAITTFKLEMGRQHILINGTKQSLDLFCS